MAKHYVHAVDRQGRPTRLSHRVRGYAVYRDTDAGPERLLLFGICRDEDPRIALHLANRSRDDLNAGVE